MGTILFMVAISFDLGKFSLKLLYPNYKDNDININIINNENVENSFITEFSSETEDLFKTENRKKSFKTNNEWTNFI